MTDGGNAENLGSSAHHCCARAVCTTIVFSEFPIPSPTTRTLAYKRSCAHTASVEGASLVLGSRWLGGVHTSLYEPTQAEPQRPHAALTGICMRVSVSETR